MALDAPSSPEVRHSPCAGQQIFTVLHQPLAAVSDTGCANSHEHYFHYNGPLLFPSLGLFEIAGEKILVGVFPVAAVRRCGAGQDT